MRDKCTTGNSLDIFFTGDNGKFTDNPLGFNNLEQDFGGIINTSSSSLKPIECGSHGKVEGESSGNKHISVVLKSCNGSWRVRLG